MVAVTSPCSIVNSRGRIPESLHLFERRELLVDARHDFLHLGQNFRRLMQRCTRARVPPDRLRDGRMNREQRD